MKNRFKLWLVLLLSVGLIGCSNKKEEEVAKEKESITELRLGVMPSTDSIPFTLAEQEGFTTAEGVSLSVEIFKSAADRDAALQAGKLDGVISDLVGIGIYHQGGLDMKIVAAPYDQFDLLVKDSSITTVADLKDQPIAFSPTTGTAYAVDMMLEEAGLEQKDIQVADIPQVPVRLELLTNDKVAAAILPEPFITIGEAQGLRVLQSTSDLKINPFAIAFTAESLVEKKEAVQGLFKAYNQAVSFIEEADSSQLLDLFVKDVGFPAEMKDKINIPDYGEIQPVATSDVEKAFRWSREAGLLKKELSVEEVMSDVIFKTE